MLSHIKKSVVFKWSVSFGPALSGRISASVEYVIMLSVDLPYVCLLDGKVNIWINHY